ncbi:SDR family NAD(P)-dependent oxidoreductase [Streptomyces sp. CB01881]|uniref:SDR family NAD(P)-dependent oxidoreductase n=1 Tax=Streptomyces sp. CB01881 TaxID=2078691 RepID=UPI0013867276|nr:SDR family NAD(P)-dependent oxidoreductase [Streptomyces sp. CB01881]
MRLLGKDFESIPGTLFFEYRTIDELAGYFSENQAERLTELLDLGQSAAPAPAAAAPAAPVPVAPAQPLRTQTAPAVSAAPAVQGHPQAAGRSRDVAVIGISGRYPKARNLDEFWKVLERGEDCIEEIPAHRWDKDEHYAAEKTPGKSSSKWGGFIDGAENFDALFFNMSPNQAALTDPQSRLFLQSAWEAMEDAGYTRKTLSADKARKVGVYLGMMWNEYQLLSGQEVVLSDRAAASNAVSYFFNLHGQSLTVDTACSSSLYAIAMAVESIRNGSASLAFAGGANLSLHPNKYVSLSQMNFFAKDGRCRSFGDGGTGYVPGEGVGCVLLKPLDQAVADGDHIHGVIRGVATVHGGKTNGMTVPNPLAQAEMVTAALADAGLSAEDVSYIEGHGTGTSLGDPIEITGLTRAFRKHTAGKQYCPIGSVKSNIGHLEGAAGVVAVTKVLLQMKHGMIAPSLHSEKLNPYIDFANTPFYVQQELEPWRRPTRTVDGVTRELPRIAGVSSFGAHGAIAHVIIEEYVPAQEPAPQTGRTAQPQLVALSAKDGDRLREKAQALLDWLSEQGREAALPDIAYTLQVGREAMEERLALVVDGHDALREKLRAFLDGGQDVEGVFHAGVRAHKDTVALLEADEEMQEVVARWLERGRGEKLAELWVKGLALDWESLGRGAEVRRIPLPTYPFAQERHWLDAPKPLSLGRPPVEPVAVASAVAASVAVAPPVARTVAVTAPAAVAEAEEPTRSLAFVEGWEPQALDGAADRQPGGVVFLCTGAERQAGIARAVRALDPALPVAFVGFGDVYRKVAADSYEVRRGEPQDYREAFRDLAANRPGIDAVVNLRALEPGWDAEDFGDVVLTLQAVAAAKLPARRLVLAGEYRDGVERALLEAHIGFERSLGLVMPQLSVVAVLQDAADPQRPADEAAWTQRLLAELRTGKAVSALYRAGGRFVSRVRPAALAERPGALRRGGTYLITGGAGGLGMIVARHLAENYGADLVLTGRSPLDAARQEMLDGLTAAGGRAVYVQADVADAQDMKRVVEQARERFGALNGVVHAAGVQGEGSVLQKEPGTFAGILEPKIRGTLALDEALAGEPVDFVCYFSSTSAVIGDFGTCDYAVGNRFQMAYAAHRDAQVAAGRLSGRTVVVNWPLWREGGMGFDQDTTTMLLRSSGQDFLETQDGIALFEQLLAQDAPQHMILVGRPSRVVRFLGLTQPQPAVAPSAPAAASAPTVPVVSAEEGLDRDLREIISGAVNIGLDKIYEDDNLSDYGFDSVSLAELAARLGSHYGVEVSPSLFYSHSTLRKLKGYFAAEHQDVLAAFYGGADDAVPATAAEVTEPDWFRAALDRAASEPAPARPAAPAQPAAAAQAVTPAQAAVDGAVEAIAAVEAATAGQQAGGTRPEPAARAAAGGSADDDAIAVIGMSGRFPGADDVDQLWSVLAEGRDTVTPVSRERLALWGEPEDSPFGAFRVGQLSGPDEFDPLFFELSPKEAQSLDPRQRLLLQESWRALEDAGWKPATTRRVGMFVGVEQGDYGDLARGTGSITANHDGILAARLSYFLDLNGPVMALNTACSSGLVAAHQACASIRNGECETALAAGISLITTPQLLDGTRQAGMLSEDGVCYAFDKRANGMVLSEAVAVVVLKKLSAAVADGDRIHAVIRASGINYDGRSNGITAPNGDAQTELLRSTYRQYGVDPADVEYVVAHGTGTRLGDPVEINALNDAFKGFTDKQQYCALTSVKSNVGHTLAASGLVSLIGLVQAMRHETIPASLHCEQESEYIAWKDSPFFVNKANRAWPERAGRRRVAAVSSFGMSGTNAHMVVESYPVQNEDEAATMPAHLLAVSAKSEESLRQRVTDLIDFLEDATRPQGLREVGATLLDGRPHFQHRCAVVARDAAEAVRLLRQWARDGQAPDVFTARVPKGFAPKAEVREAGDRLLEQAARLHHDGALYADALRAVAKAYCQGHDLAWLRLFGGRRPAPVSLPGYPFARKRLWQQDVARQAAAAAGHPLLRRSAEPGRPAGTTLTGREFFLRDHVVAGEKVLPGVAHLELARAAHAAARADQGGRPGTVVIRDVVWMRPVKVGDTPSDVRVELDEDAAGVRYRILAPVAGAQPAVHSQGRIVVGDTPSPAPLDLARLRAECGSYEIDAAEAYASYRRKGIQYGPAFQGLVRIFAGEGQVLAELALPRAAEDGLDRFGLHPSLLDAALQASIGLLDAVDGAHLPYALEELEILGPCTPTMWAWLRRSERPAGQGGSAQGGSGQGGSGQGGDKLDVDLCDAQGNVCVRIRAFSTRPVKRAAQPLPAATPATSEGRLTLLKPGWEQAQPPFPPAAQRAPGGRILLVGDQADALGSVLAGHAGVEVLLLRAGDTVEGLRARLARGGAVYDHVVWVAGGAAPAGPESDDLIDRQEQGAYAGFRLAKALLALGYEKRALEWTAVTVRSQFVGDTDRVDPTHAGVHGLLGSLAKENPRWRVRLADVEELRDSVLREALDLPAEPAAATWAHRGGHWYRQTLVPVPAEEAAREDATAYKHGGVYVVIGGAGGLGAAWTEHVVRNYRAQVVWIGRRPEDEAIRARTAELALLGPAPWYLQADATDRESLAAAVAQVKARFPQIHGVVHSAIALLDQSVARMTEDRFRAAVRAKVDVSVRMAQVFAGEPLDFVLFFSSLNSFQRSAGQSNYVCGCVFKDAFARLLQQTWPATVKVMNWGYWGSVGVVAADAYQRRMELDGIGSIEPAEGMAALDALLSGPFDQLAVEKTTTPKRAAKPAAGAAGAAGAVRTADEHQLRRVLADSGSARGFDDELLCELLFTQLRAVGLRAEGGSVAGLRAGLKPGGGYDRWLDESLRILAGHGYLEYREEGAGHYTPTAKAPADGDAVWRRWEALCREGNGANAYVALLDPAVRAFPEVLTGRRPATDVIFPGSSMALVEGVYRHCDSADALNEIMADQVAARVAALLDRDPARRVRIFEIGSGTGGTSEKVLRRLAPYRDAIAEYRYTDLSKYFLLKGRKEFGAEHPYVRFELFDVERGPAEQGVTEGGYDIVLATNVLHATHDVRAAVRHAKALLGADGELVLNEMAARTLFLHLTFGLLDGWWLYQDAELRIEGCPGLAPASWRTVLEEAGFGPVAFPAAAVHEAGHQIVVARSGADVPAAAVTAAAEPQAVQAVQNQPAAPVVSEGEVRAYVQRAIVTRIQDSLGLAASEVHEEDAFSDYGVDSILGVQLIQDLNEDLGGVLVTTDLFDHGSVRRLAAYVADTFPGQARALLPRSTADAQPAVAAPVALPVAADVPVTPVVTPVVTPAVAAPAPVAVQEARVREAILTQIEQSLGLDRREISEEDAFADYGVDSILGVGLTQDLNTALGTTLAATDLFDHSSVRRLARYVVEFHRDELAASAVAEPEAAPAPRSAVVPAAAAPARVVATSVVPAPEAPAAAVPTAVVAPAPAAPASAAAPAAAADPSTEPIAIIGLSGRFGTAKDVHQLWQYLAEGRSLVGEIDRWDLSAYVSPGAGHPRYASLMDDIDLFDPMFFQISGLEATYMDPQQRLTLEESWKALEDAGYAGEAVRGRDCGVYIGTQISDYLTAPAEDAPAQAMWGNAEAIIPARISYYLDLQGPAIAVETACSGSLVAIHLACQALRAGEVELALAGGVSVQCAPDYYLAAHKAGMLSDTGQCHTFDERADGFVPGEGVGMVVLKRLRDALADGDHIHGVVRASGLNQDGTSNGITAPSAKSQERLERSVYDTFGIDPAGIQLVEAHGTGTKLGDPIEFQALTRAFRAYTDKQEYCAIGSVKTNIGHAAPASGVAGLAKVLLAMHHRELPRSLHFEQGNAHIAFQGSPFYVNTVHRAWTAEPGRPRLAALSSFGFSGTNAHLVIEEAPERRRTGPATDGHLVVLSALSPDQLRTQAAQLADHLAGRPETGLGDVALTLLLGRRHCPVRLACVARDTAELVARLREWLADGREEHVRVADLADHAPRPQTSLEQFGNSCIRQCAEGAAGTARTEQLEAVRDLYLQGYELEYARLFPAGAHLRVPLPTYPFLRQRYWLPEEAVTRRPALPAAPVPTALAAPRATGPEDADHLSLAPLWVREPAPGQGAEPADGLILDGNVVVVGGDADERAAIAARCAAPHFLADGEMRSVEALTAALRRIGTVRHLVWISPADAAATAGATALLQRTDTGVVAFFRLTKALFALGYGGEELSWTVVTRQTQSVLRGETVHPADAAVLGLAGVMARELPNWGVKSFDLGVAEPAPVAALLGAPARSVRALRRGQWFRRSLAEVALPAPARTPYKEGGVYVVLGGAGGIGELWSEDVIRRFGAQVVWIGRREKDDAIQRKIDRLGALGRAPWYVPADAADPVSLRAAYEKVKERFGTVHGVVQSVFGLVDQSLPNTSEEQFRQGLSAKVDASVRMAEVFDVEGLDFLLFFSSIASINQTMGYCSYVAGNAFEDALADRLSAERGYAVKVVNWGYWGAVGSGLDVPQHVRERIYQQEGLGDIDPALAMDAVERLLAAPLGQLVYVNTRKPERFEAYSAHESVRVLSPAAAQAGPLAPELPSRQGALRTVETQAKDKLRELDALLAKLLWCELHGRGWFPGGVFDAASFQQANGIIAKYDRWLQETLKLFVQQGHLVETGTGYRAGAADPVDAAATAAEWERNKQAWLADPELRASVDLVDKTIRALTGILTGATSAVDVIFPGSSLDLVEGIYKRNMIADYFNDVVGDCTVALVERRLAQDPGARFRILEVGAGTGGTTATVMRRLRPYAEHIGEYCYTDLSRAFLIHGRQQWGAENPFLRTELYDAGRPVAEQGFEEGGYDLVIATNVLHATKDIRVSLRNSKALLRPGGAVVVNEIDGYTVFGMLTFALLDGWWLYDDPELRDAGGPGLEPAMWRSVLEWEGFAAVEFPARDAHPLGQQVVVAFSDGVIRQADGVEPPAEAGPQPVAPAEARPAAPAAAQPEPEAAPQPVRVDEAAFKDAMRTYLRELVARTLLIPAGSIDAREPLSAYGIDSILILQLLNNLKKDLGEVSSTLFFEYRTIEELTGHFAGRQDEALERAVGLAPAAVAAPAAPAAVMPAPAAAAAPAEPGRTTPVAPAAAAAPAAAPEPAPNRGGDIAIVGMSARFPQAETLDAYWENLRSGRNSVTEIPADRWPLDGFYEPDKERAAAEGKSYSKWGGFLDGFADFDPLFFEMTPNEAMEIDPQERLFLQETWKAFEDAGYTRARIERDFDGRVGVFVGITRAGHNLYGPERWRRGDTTYPYTSFGSAANRVSFKLNLNGPSMPVDTLCSSSLTALHEACEHLLRGDCELAVTGGVNLYLHPSSYLNLCNLQMLADEEKCRSFGLGGNGFVPGEGVGAIVLKRLEDAERDGDHIHAVIRGTSINHGGTTNGYTVPNPVAQGKVVRRALDRAGVDARTISYIEAHGTGTALGDPIEINGLTRAFSGDTRDVQYCAIGSAKSNIGHAEAAAGIAGVLKVVLQLQHGELAPSLHAEELNPHIDFASTPFVVQREQAEWKRPVVTVDGVTTEVPRRAGVSSFGAGGANAHVVIEEYVPAAPAAAGGPADGPAVVVLSAKDEERLREQAAALLRWLPAAELRGVSVTDVAHTLQTGREAMPERLGTVVGSLGELRERLQGFLERPERTEGLHRGRVKRQDRALSALTADEDMGAILEAWIAKGKYAKVLDLWVNGFELDWRSLHPGRTVRVVPLPTYPFARERYWIAEKRIDGPEDGAGAVEAGLPDARPDALLDDVLDSYLSDSLGMEAAAEHIRRSFDDAGRTTDNGGR